MNQFIDNEIVKEISSAQNVMYILNEKSAFSLTQYKVMQNNQKQGLVKCAKSTYNGKLKLVYFNEALQPLSSFIDYINIDKLLFYLEKALKYIIELKNNGFLNLCNLDFSADKIFVNQESESVELIYVPLEESKVVISEFEKKMIADISEIVASASKISMHIANRFCTEMLLQCKSIEETYSFIKSNRMKFQGEDEVINDISQIVSYTEPAKKEEFKTVDNTTAKKRTIVPVLHCVQEMILRSEDISNPLEFKICNDEFIIGKKLNSVDGYIPSNAAVSRQHCMIMKNDMGFTVTDLGSANGTFVNGIKLAIAETCEIKDGDVLRVANITFKASVI